MFQESLFYNPFPLSLPGLACADCAGWNESIHYAESILLVFSWTGSHIVSIAYCTSSKKYPAKFFVFAVLGWRILSYFPQKYIQCTSVQNKSKTEATYIDWATAVVIQNVNKLLDHRGNQLYYLFTEQVFSSFVFKYVTQWPGNWSHMTKLQTSTRLDEQSRT